MPPVSGTPPWDALVTELGSAPSDGVVAEPAKSTGALWVIVVVMTAVMFVPVIVRVGGRFFPYWALLVCLINGLVVHEIHRRGVRAGYAPLASLGLGVVPRPTPGIFSRLFSTQLALRGRRWGRAVFVEVDLSLKRAGPTGASVVTVAASSPRFELIGRGGRLVAGAGAPAPVVALVDAIGQGPWDAVAVTAGPEGISVRRGATWDTSPDAERTRRWLYDLWLAEHLARVVS